MKNGNEYNPLTLKASYVKDVSFETEIGPKVWDMKWEPDINCHFESKAIKLANLRWEVVLSATVTVRLEGKVAYLIELHQGGLFHTEEVDRKVLRKALSTHGRNELFSDLCDSLNAVIERGGFPHVIFESVPFDQLIDGEVA